MLVVERRATTRQSDLSTAASLRKGRVLILSRRNLRLTRLFGFDFSYIPIKDEKLTYALGKTA